MDYQVQVGDGRKIAELDFDIPKFDHGCTPQIRLGPPNIRTGGPKFRFISHLQAGFFPSTYQYWLLQTTNQFSGV
jgi:hypothetical protein